MLRILLGSLFLSAMALHGIAADQTKAPPKELVQYVREAAKLGLEDKEIQQNAVIAGWPAPLVKETLALVHTMDEAAVAASPAKTPEPASEETSTGSLDPAGPASISRPPQPTAATANPLPSEPPKTEGPSRDYRIGEGDIVQISVWKEPEASVQSAVVRPDGKIAMPLLKEIEIVGLTPKEAEKSIADRLSKYIPGADVTVVVSNINSKRIYVVGAVKKEGPIPYTYRMTIMQALSEAGGLTDYAKRKKIYVLRAENGNPVRLPFDYDSVLKGRRMELNISLLPNDTLVIPH
jgi:polysaccharide export outer membrane protein